MTLSHKSFDLIDFKTDVDGDPSGTFTATVAVFNNVDKIGDRIMPGAFVKSLAAWETSGDPIPVIFNHDWASPHAHIGVVEKAMETPQGLLVKGRLDIADNDVARQVHRLMQRRSLKEFSFGYSIPKGGEKKAEDGANELLEIDLAEVGPTLKGMNPATELHAVKSALGVEKPPRDAETLRRETVRVEREAVEDRLPELREPVPESEPEPEPPAPPAKPVPPDAETLRKAALVLAREEEESRLPEVPPVKPEPEVEEKPPEPDPVPTKSVEELRRDATRVQREEEQARLPDVPPVEPPEDLRSVLERLETELQEVKTAHGEARALIDDLTEQLKKAEVTDKETTSRSVDPLRKQADAVALEFASDGRNLRRPPKTPAPVKPEPELELGDLKRRMREEILVHLSGGTI